MPAEFPGTEARIVAKSIGFSVEQDVVEITPPLFSLNISIYEMGILIAIM